jgi:hypothetical protein
VLAWTLQKRRTRGCGYPGNDRFIREFEQCADRNVGAADKIVCATSHAVR